MKSLLKYETVAGEMAQKLTGLVAVTENAALTLAPGYCMLSSNICRHQAHPWCIYLYKGKTLICMKYAINLKLCSQMK